MRKGDKIQSGPLPLDEGPTIRRTITVRDSPPAVRGLSPTHDSQPGGSAPGRPTPTKFGFEDRSSLF